MPAASLSLAPENITGLLLAGGRGSRLGGADKGLLEIAGKPLAAYVLQRFQPQVGRILISANRHLTTWQQWHWPVLADDLADFPGPLAGIRQGLAACPSPWLAVVPCDTPYLPCDLVARLAAGLCAAKAQAAVAVSAGQRQPAFTLLAQHLLPELDAFLVTGQRKLGAWLDEINAVAVPFPRPQDFYNINTPVDLANCAIMRP